MLLQADDVNVPILNQKHIEVLAPYKNKKVTLGIRSDSILHTQDTGHIKGMIELIEIMGAESLVFLKASHNEFSVRIETASLEEAHNQAGGQIGLNIIEEKIHLFDNETEDCLF
jgi:ABC-type sugar transport system ATPase subunit